MARDPHGGANFYGTVSYQSALGWLYLARGAEEGRHLLRQALAKEEETARNQPGQAGVSYRMAAILSSLGEPERALEKLREAIEAGWIDYRSLALDPRFDGIRPDSRFGSILATLQQRVQNLREGNKPGDLAQQER